MSEILILFFGAVSAGLLGSLTGLGGGVVIIPLLTLGFGVPMHYAIGASLISVIGTSSGAAAAFVKEGFTNVRIGMFLEIATTIGAIIGASMIGLIKPNTISILFGCILIYSALSSIFMKKGQDEITVENKHSTFLKLNGDYPTPQGFKRYVVQNIPLGFLPL